MNVYLAASRSGLRGRCFRREEGCRKTKAARPKKTLIKKVRKRANQETVKGIERCAGMQDYLEVAVVGIEDPSLGAEG